jgi:hypothetical protein
MESDRPVVAESLAVVLYPLCTQSREIGSLAGFCTNSSRSCLGVCRLSLACRTLCVTIAKIYADRALNQPCRPILRP